MEEDSPSGAAATGRGRHSCPDLSPAGTTLGPPSAETTDPRSRGNLGRAVQLSAFWGEPDVTRTSGPVIAQYASVNFGWNTCIRAPHGADIRSVTQHVSGGGDRAGAVRSRLGRATSRSVNEQFLHGTAARALPSWPATSPAR